MCHSIPFDWEPPKNTLEPEYPGDIRDPAAGCWHVINGNYNSPAFDSDYCRNQCVPGTRYCAEH